MNEDFTLLYKKTMIITSYWGYPFGGGEEYLAQTADWATCAAIAMKVYWLCFATAENKNYEKFSIEHINNFTIIRVPGGFDDLVLYNWLKLLNPDIVHHQGHLRKEFHYVCSKMRIPFVTGIHFWTGVITLDPSSDNIDILHNANLHNVDPDFLELYDSPYCTFYSVSKFVTECVETITKKPIEYTAYSGSSISKCHVQNNDPINNSYVTVINIHKKKGGDLILWLLENIPDDIPFLVVKTEYMSDDLDKKIEDVINKRNAHVTTSTQKNTTYSIFTERVCDVKEIYARTKIFLAPSLVDETFCRTVNEAMMNGIPILTSGRGNLSYLVNESNIIDVNDFETWKERIIDLYDDPTLLKNESNASLTKYQEYSESVCKEMFFSVIREVLNHSKAYNIMIITPWCDQGLGIQSRNYLNVLRANGYKCHVFSFNPYGQRQAIELQKNPLEWITDNIYYSSNDREHIQDEELLKFIKKYNIGKCIIPETCWFRIFEIAKLLRSNDIKVYAVPNIEIVRRDEISKHKYFYKILANNNLCRDIFIQHNINNIESIGYGIINNNIQLKPKTINDKLKFLFIGGMNAFSRKQILEICEGFSVAYEKMYEHEIMSANLNINPTQPIQLLEHIKTIHLTCTILNTNDLEIDDINKLEKYINHPGITFIQTHQTYEDIIDLYYSHHISIQVSKHEGLGLGFYEALATGTPIISLKTPPHNEIIIDNVNGWLIDCYYKDMTDNPMSFIKSAYFDPILLADKILDIVQNKTTSIESILHNFEHFEHLSDIFIKKFINAIAE